ncbi:MAG: ferredoxin--NADP reductase [Chitinophagales bacterium]|nr:ferredoxin--NADP reductase [Chitinophagales bacterium]
MKSEILKLRIQEITYPLAGVATLKLFPINASLPRYQSGQFLTFIFDHLGPKEIRRSYSLSSAYGVDDHLQITVKQQINGAASTFLTKTAKKGDILTALPPAGQFTLPAAPHQQHYIMLAAGSGITPIFSIIKDLLFHHSNTHIFLIYSNRNEQNIIFKEEISDFLIKYPQRFNCLHLLSDMQGTSHENKTPNLSIKRGRLSNFFLEDWVHKNWNFSLTQTHVYLCGPKGFMLKAVNTLRFMRYPVEQLHQEVYDIISPFKPSVDSLMDSTIYIFRKDQQYQFKLEAGESILDAALKNGIQLPYSCNSGSCTTCSVECIQGTVKMYTQGGPTDSQATKGTVFTCVGYPESDTVVLKL